MRITGASTGSAPRASSARASSPACSRARVTTMRRPCNDAMRRCNLTVALPIIKQCSGHFALRWPAFARAAPPPASAMPRTAPLQRCHAPLQSHRGSPHYQAMLRSLRAALARFCARRAAACQRDAPHRALAWLRLGCKFAPSFADTFPALVHLSRELDDRWGAVEAARAASVRFPDHADAWMLLGEALQMVFRQDEALGAFEQALALEE